MNINQCTSELARTEGAQYASQGNKTRSVRVPAAVLHAAMKEIEPVVSIGLDLTDINDPLWRVGRDDHLLETYFEAHCAGVIDGAGAYYEAAIVERAAEVTVTMLMNKELNARRSIDRLYISGKIKGFEWRVQQGSTVAE